MEPSGSWPHTGFIGAPFKARLVREVGEGVRKTMVVVVGRGGEPVSRGDGEKVSTFGGLPRERA
ncbi:uncharacterized protein J3R85_016225 [Psidium guajava]|nr:uncharacterized protein J3R85_016225 [Psidium guajava]